MPVRDLTLTMSLYPPADAAPLPMAVATAAAPGADPAPAPALPGVGHGELIDLAAGLLKAFLRSRGIITAVVVAVALTGPVADARAAGGRCAGEGRRAGGPVRQFIPRIQARREARAWSTAAAAVPAPAPVAAGPRAMSAERCADGRCPVAPTGR